jgi:hypothetical protein
LIRIRERILQQGCVENGFVVEVLPPSGIAACVFFVVCCCRVTMWLLDAQLKGERWFMQVVEGVVKNAGSNNAKVASCKVRFMRTFLSFWLLLF